MNSFGAKLSNHVINMKFMRRTKDKVDKKRSEEKFREHYAPSPHSTKEEEQKSQILPSTSSTTRSRCIIQEVRSYSQCERHIFGRQSFGGFNPILEQNVRNGIWRPFYIDPLIPQQGDHDDQDQDIKKEENDEMDVSDEEMAKHYGSLVATLGKRFAKNAKSAGGGGGPPNKRMKFEQGAQDGKKKGGWKGFFRAGKKRQEQGDVDNEGQERPSSSKRGGAKDGQEGAGSKRVGAKARRGGGGGKKDRLTGDAHDAGAGDSEKKKFMKPKDD